MRQTLTRLLLVVLFFLLAKFVIRLEVDSLLIAFVSAWILEGIVAELIAKP